MLVPYRGLTALMALALFASAGVEDQTAGFVLELRGRWTILDDNRPSRGPLRAGEAIIGGATLVADAKATDPRIRVAIPHGTELSNCIIDDAAREHCSQRLLIPQQGSTDPGVLSRLALVIHRLVRAERGRYVTTISRGSSSIHPGPVLVSSNRVDLSMVVEDSNPRRLQLTCVSGQDKANTVSRMEVSSRERVAMFDGTAPLPGLCLLEETATRSAARVWVIDNPQIWDSVRREFTPIIAATKNWQTHRFALLSAALDELQGKYASLPRKVAD